MKKRILVFAVAGVLTLTLGTASAFAATHVRRNAAKAGNGAGNGSYVDADNDGVCDNLGTGAGRGNGRHGRGK